MGMQALAKGKAWSASRVARAAYLAMAFLLAGFTLFDTIASGPVRVTDVALHDVDAGQQMVVSLPYRVSLPLHTHYEFRFDIPGTYLNRLYPLVLKVQGCVHELYVGEQAIPLPHAGDTMSCTGDNVRMNPFFSAGQSSMPVRLLVESVLDSTRISLVRLPYLTFFQGIVWLLCAAVLALMALAATCEEWRKTTCRGWVAALFIITSVPRALEADDGMSMVEYWCAGPGIVFMALLGMYWPPVRGIYRRIDAGLDSVVRRPRQFAMLCSVAFLLLAALMSQLLFDRLPHISDSHMQYVQGKIFAAGKAYLPSHPLREFFDYPSAVNNGKFFSSYLPGHALLLAVGHWLGLPWLVDPALGALNVWAVFLLACELGGSAAGCIAAALMLISPTVVFMSSEYMNHVSCMLFLTVFLLGYIRLCKTGHWKYALLAGGSAGLAFMVRLQTVVPFALPVALHALWVFLKHPKAAFPRSALLALSFAAGAGYLLYYDWVTMGDAFTVGYSYYNIPLLPKFLSLSRWAGIMEDIFRAHMQIQQVHLYLFGWPTSSLWGVLLLCLLGGVRGYARLLMACFITHCLGLVFIFPDSGGGLFQNRFIYESSANLIILTALGIQLAVRKATATAKGQTAYPVRAAAFAAVAGLFLSAVPGRVASLYRTYAHDYYHGSWSYNYMLEHSVETPALVFLPPWRKPVQHIESIITYYHRSPDDRDPIIFVYDLGDENRKLMDFYPGRHVYIADGWRLKKIR